MKPQDVQSEISIGNALLPHAVWSSYPMTLSEIYRPEINLAILERELAAEVRRYAEFLATLAGNIAFARMLAIEAIKPALRQYLPLRADQEDFIQDVENAATMMGLLFGVDQVGVRLRNMSTAICPNFHNDKVPCRLLLTYHGKGTQWLDEDNLDRYGLNNRSTAANGKQIWLDENRIHEIGIGHIAIFKGEMLGRQ